MKDKFRDITPVKQEEIEEWIQQGISKSLDKFKTQVNLKLFELFMKFDTSMKKVEQINIDFLTNILNIIDHQNDLLVTIAT